MNKKVIERILKNLIENDTYTIEKEETEILINYIADLQRKEYNNSKAIEYVKQCTSSPDKYERFISTGESKILLNILEKGE
jgi:hypothetical protein